MQHREPFARFEQALLGSLAGGLPREPSIPTPVHPGPYPPRTPEVSIPTPVGPGPYPPRIPSLPGQESHPQYQRYLHALGNNQPWLVSHLQGLYGFTPPMMHIPERMPHLGGPPGQPAGPPRVPQLPPNLGASF